MRSSIIRCTGHATVAALRAESGIRALDVSHVANPALEFDTPSGKIELYSEQAAALGLPPLPSFDARGAGRPRLSARADARAHAGALPQLLQQRAGTALARSPRIRARAVAGAGRCGAAQRNRRFAAIRIFNARGDMAAQARVTDRIPAGTVWMRDGWPGLNRLTAGAPVLPDAAVDLFAFSAGQATSTRWSRWRCLRHQRLVPDPSRPRGVLA